jgi:cyclase
MRELNPEVVVPGHGPVGGLELLDTTEAYLLWIQRLAQDGMAAGRTPSEVAREADLGPFAELLEPERIIPNLHRAYAEERALGHDSSLDMTAVIEEMAHVFEEMVSYRGAPLRCTA